MHRQACAGPSTLPALGWGARLSCKVIRLSVTLGFYMHFAPEELIRRNMHTRGSVGPVLSITSHRLGLCLHVMWHCVTTFEATEVCFQHQSRDGQGGFRRHTWLGAYQFILLEDTSSASMVHQQLKEGGSRATPRGNETVPQTG